MTLSITFRTDDPTRWGTGTGTDLLPRLVDLNFWVLKAAVEQIQIDIPPAAVGIDYFSVSGDQFFVHMTDHSVLGPYQLPVVPISFRGAWAPVTNYFINDIVTATGGAYFVLVNHSSAGTFDPAATDGMGHNLYGLLLDTSSIASSGSPVFTVSGATFTPNAANAGKYHRCTNVAGCTVTLANDADLSQPLAVSSEMHYRQCTSNPIVFSPGSSVVLNGIAGFSLATGVQGAVVTVKKVAANTYDVFGLLAV